MSLKNRREQITKEIRRKHLEDYFKKVRMSLQENEANHHKLTPQQLSAIGPNQILEAIHYFKSQRQPLNFQIINQYAVGSDKPMSGSVFYELANVVLESHRNNGYAIASLAHFLSKYEQAPFLNDITNLSGKIMQMLEQNIEGQSKIRNGEAIAYLIYNILFLSDNKEDFYFLSKYFHVFADSYGYFNRAVILLLSIASSCRQLLPPSTFVQGLLRCQIDYTKLQAIDFKALCQFLQNFVCFDLEINLYIDLVRWIEKRLKEKKFPISLKTNLIKIITMSLCYQSIAQHTNQIQDINFGVMQEIILIARFGVTQCKIEAIVCLCQFIRILDEERLRIYAENTQILEIIVISLELSLQSELYCRLLQTLGMLFCLDQKYVKIARRMGVSTLLDLFFNSGSIKVGNVAAQVYQFMNHN